MRFFRRVRVYESIPRGYGVVYDDFLRQESVVCPLPFSFALAVLHHVYCYVRCPLAFWDCPEITLYWRKRARRAERAYENEMDRMI